MTRTAKAFVSSLLGASLTLAALTGPAVGQEAWLNDADECESSSESGTEALHGVTGSVPPRAHSSTAWLMARWVEVRAEV